MPRYIELDALVAEIKRLRDKAFELYGCSQFDSAYNKVLKSIDTLEVKEVDLDEETLHSELRKIYTSIYDSKDIKSAKHFFKLGLKAQKDNIRHSMDETPNYPCDILLVTDVDNMFLFKYMENGRPVDRETPYFHNIQNGKCWYYCNDIMDIH